MNEEIFEKNLQLFGRFNPQYIEKVKEADDPYLTFFQTQQGELSLKKQRKEGDIYYHSPENANGEAEEWVKKHLWLQGSIVYLYGLGLGLYYDAIKNWLRGHPDNLLIFLEDDLSVIHRFLETEKASEILLDPQVYLKAFYRPQGDNDWNLLRKDLDELFWAFVARRYFPTVSHLYETTKKEFAESLYTQLRINLISTNDYFNEFFKWSLEQDFLNFYHNLSHISEASLVQNFFQEFKDIPVIICGAGPSLNEQMAFLKNLQKKALLIASGSALNVLSHQGVNAHLCARLDPTPTQKSRILSQAAFEVPFFYLNRFSYEGLEHAHGTPLLLKWQDIFETAQWFENQLGLTLPEHFETGISSSNFAAEIAFHLGGNPIILLGMDLCYSEEKLYATGHFTHPTDSQSEKDKLKPSLQQIPFMNSDGLILHTRWDWIQEAGNFSLLAQKHSKAKLLNATLNKLPMVDIQNRSLNEIAEEYFTTSTDILNLVHANIQLGFTAPISQEKVFRALSEWRESLKRCLNLNPQEISKELCFIYLKKVLEAFEFSVTFQKVLLKVHPESFTEELKVQLEDEIERRRIFCLKQIIEKHLEYLEKVVSQWKEKVFYENNNKIDPPSNEESIYLFDKIYKVYHPSLQIDFEERIDQELEEKKYHYSDGKLKGHSFFKNGLLHGPSRFYSKEGKLLAESWFIYGQRSGKTLQFHLNGSLYSLQYYVNDKKEGNHRYYYPHGFLKTEMSFVQDKLNGIVKLYDSQGILRRELYFREGVLHGRERMWNRKKNLVLETFYEQGKPQGYSRKWHDNGQLQTQILFHEKPHRYDLWEWNDTGELVHQSQQGIEKELDQAIQDLKDFRQKLDQNRS